MDGMEIVKVAASNIYLGLGLALFGIFAREGLDRNQLDQAFDDRRLSVRTEVRDYDELVKEYEVRKLVWPKCKCYSWDSGEVLPSGIKSLRWKYASESDYATRPETIARDAFRINCIEEEVSERIFTAKTQYRKDNPDEFRYCEPCLVYLAEFRDKTRAIRDKLIALDTLRSRKEARDKDQWHFVVLGISFIVFVIGIVKFEQTHAAAIANKR